MKYKSKGLGTIYETIWSDETGALLENMSTRSRSWWKNGSIKGDLVEYKEPRKITFFVNIYETDGKLTTGGVWGTREKALRAEVRNIVDTMEITWTEKV